MKFLNLTKLNEPVITKNLIILILFIYICWLFKTYGGNTHSIYLDLWQYTSGLFSYENDFFLPRSNQPQLSILYTIFKYLQINPNNDYHGFSLHIIFSSIAGFCLFKIIRDFTCAKENGAALVILFALLLVGNIFVMGNLASWIIRVAGSPTYFAHSLIFVFLWLLLMQSTILLFAISSLMLLMAVKAVWFTVGVGILYSIIFIRPIRRNFWIIGPLAVVAYLSTLGGVPSDYDSKLFLFNAVLERDYDEVAFHLQPLDKLISLIISFPIYLYMLLRMNRSQFRNLSFIILILSFGCFVFGFFYPLYGGEIWPAPRLLALSATRALGLYQLFFWLLVSLTIYKSNIFSIFKVSLLASIFYSLTLSLDAILYSLFILLFAWLIVNFYKQKNFLGLGSLVLHRSQKFSYFVTLIFFLTLLPGVMYLFITHFNHVDAYAFKKINKWTMGPMTHDHNRLDTLLALRGCHDFRLLDVDPVDPVAYAQQYPDSPHQWGLQYIHFTPAIAGKSHYAGTYTYNHFDKELIQTHRLRWKVSKNIYKSLFKKQNVSSEDINLLFDTGVVLIINDNDRMLFPENITSIDLKNRDTLMLFLSNSEKNLFLDNCKPILKS